MVGLSSRFFLCKLFARTSSNTLLDAVDYEIRLSVGESNMRTQIRTQTLDSPTTCMGGTRKLCGVLDLQSALLRGLVEQGKKRRLRLRRSKGIVGREGWRRVQWRRRRRSLRNVCVTIISGLGRRRRRGVV